MRLRRLAIAALLAVGLLASSLPTRAQEGSWSLARLSFTSGWDAIPALVALERGFFSRHRITVSSLPLSNGRALVESIAAGTTDFAAVPQRTLLVMASLKLPFRVVSMAGWNTRLALIVRADDPVTSLEGLKGKTIGLAVGSETVAALMRYLNAKELQPTDFQLSTLQTADMAPAFREGQIDAICASAHFTQPLVDAGEARELLTHEDMVSTIGWIAAEPLIASESVVTRDPDLVQRFVDGWIEGLRFLQSDPDDAAKVLRIFLHRQGVTVSSAQARSWVGYTRFDRYVWTPDDVADATYNGWGLHQAGMLKVEPEIEGYIDNHFVEHSLERFQKPAATP